MMVKKLIPPRWLLYLLYGLVLTGTLLFIRFPAGKVEAFLLSKVGEAIPGSTCKYQSINYLFPFSAEIDEVQFRRESDDEQLLLFEKLVFTPSLTGFGRELTFTADLYEGNAQGRLKIFPIDKKYLLADVRLAGAKLEKIDYLKHSLQREITGGLSGSGEYEGSWVLGFPKSGFGEFKVSNGSLVLRQPILAVPKLEFDELGMKFSLKEETFELSDGSLKGSPFHADFQGNLMVTEDTPAWQIGLTGKIRIDNEFVKDKPQLLRAYKRMQKQFGNNGGLPFQVNGPVPRPRFRFGGV